MAYPSEVMVRRKADTQRRLARIQTAWGLTYQQTLEVERYACTEAEAANLAGSGHEVLFLASYESVRQIGRTHAEGLRPYWERNEGLTDAQWAHHCSVQTPLSYETALHLALSLRAVYAFGRNPV